MKLAVDKITKRVFAEIARLAFEKEIDVSDATLTEFEDGSAEISCEYDRKIQGLELVLRSDFYVFQRNWTGVIFLVKNHAEIQEILNKYKQC